MAFIKEVTIYENKKVRLFINQCHNKGNKMNLFTIRRDDSTGLGEVLGMIEWSGRWRQYILTPLKQSVWSAGYLSNIVTFIEKQNKKNKKNESKNNHTIGCNLEGIADFLRFRGYNKEAEQLDLIASRIK